MVAGLPDDTVAAFGLSLEEGWADAMLDYVKSTVPEEADRSTSSSRSSRSETGLAFPEDLETLLGEGVTVSRRQRHRPRRRSPTAARARSRWASGSRATPTRSRPCSTRSRAGRRPRLAEFMKVTEGDGYAVLALQDDYRGELESGGGLGDSDAYTKVVESDDAQSVLFVNFDADDDWLVRLTEDSPEVSDNLEPLSAFGVSGWVDGDVVHGLFKLTTD